MGDLLPLDNKPLPPYTERPSVLDWIRSADSPTTWSEEDAREVTAYVDYLEAIRNIAANLDMAGVMRVDTAPQYKAKATVAWEMLRALLRPPSQKQEQTGEHE